MWVWGGAQEMKDTKPDVAAVVALFYESIFAPKSWIGLSEQAFVVPDGAAANPIAAKTFDKADLEPILPYLEQALEYEALRSTSEEKEKFRALKLQDLPLPVVIVGDDLEIVSMTTAAEGYLESGSLLGRHGRFLTSDDMDFRENLQSTLSNVLKTGQSAALAHSGQADGFGVILIAPLPRGLSGDGEFHAALFFNFGLHNNDEISPILMEAHGLTRSEAEVVAFLIQGMSLEEISTRKKISINTVRTQIKQVYTKTGSRRQGELVSLVLSGPAMWMRLLKTDKMEAGKPEDSYLGLGQQMTLRDGRFLSYGDFGPRHGSPVILIHQLYGLRTEREDDEALLEDLNIRLIVPERPGVGGSSPHAGQTLQDWSRDMAELADRLEVARFSVIGISGGGPHAMACAAWLPERVTRLGLVASSAPVDELPDAASDTLPKKFFTSMARHWPKGARALLEIRYRRMYEAPEDAMKDFATRGSEADKALLNDPEIHRICLRNLREAGEIPPSALTEDLIMVSRPWGFSVSEISAPTFLWHGRQDHYCHPEHADALSNLIPNCTTTIRDDWGHYFYYAEWKALLAEFIS